MLLQNSLPHATDGVTNLTNSQMENSQDHFNRYNSYLENSPSLENQNSQITSPQIFSDTQPPQNRPTQRPYYDPNYPFPPDPQTYYYPGYYYPPNQGLGNHPFRPDNHQISLGYYR